MNPQVTFHLLSLSLCSAAYGLIERPNDFASYLLAIAICNLLLYCAFYIIMKVGSGASMQMRFKRRTCVRITCLK